MMIFTYNNLLEYKSIDIFSAKPGERNSGPTGKNRPLLSPGVRTICHVPRTPLVERYIRVVSIVHVVLSTVLDS